MINQKAIRWDDLESIDTVINQVRLDRKCPIYVEIVHLVNLGNQCIEKCSCSLFIRHDDSPFDD